MNWLLLVAVILIGGGAFAGWRAGFVKTAFSLASTIVAMIVTLVFSPVVTNALKQNETFYQGVKEKIAAVVDFSGEGDDSESFIDGLALPDSIKSILKENETTSGVAKEQKQNLNDSVCEVLTNVILNALGYVITFVVTAAALAVLCAVLNVISRLPVLNQINTLAGIALGALEGLFLLWLVFLMITMLGSTEFGQAALTLVSENKILNFLYNSNVLSKLIFG